jgi:hypothetical protein
MTCQEIFDGAVLTVGGNYSGLHCMSVNERCHTTRLTDYAGCCFYPGDNFIEGHRWTDGFCI